MTRCEKCQKRYADRVVTDIPDDLRPADRGILARFIGRRRSFRVCPVCDDGCWDRVEHLAREVTATRDLMHAA